LKRDWDLIRKILLAAEDMPAGGHLNANDFNWPDNGVLVEHVQLLVDERYIEAAVRAARPNGVFVIRRLLWDGHDLLAKMRSEGWWNQMKALAAKKGVELTFDVIKSLAMPALAHLYSTSS
jgi:hypothetical protein